MITGQKTLCCLLMLGSIVNFIGNCEAQNSFVCSASYYTVASCLAESGQYTMANGKELDDEEYTFASWDFRFGERAKITNIRNNRSVVAVCTDRGPAKRFYRKGRKIDVSLACAKSLGFIKEGLAQVKVEVVHEN